MGDGERGFILALFLALRLSPFFFPLQDASPNFMTHAE